jgi:hypothetical protein
MSVVKQKDKTNQMAKEKTVNQTCYGTKDIVQRILIKIYKLIIPPEISLK